MDRLDELIKEYAQEKESASLAKSNVDSLNKEIKRVLAEEGLDEYSTELYTISKTEINTDKLDESALAIKIKELYPDIANQVVKTIDVLDLDKLEDLVYNRIIEADVVSSCIVHREPTVRLNIREKKEEDENEQY